VADHRHKRDTNARLFNPFRARAIVIAGPLAVVATASAVTLGVVNAEPATRDLFSALPAAANAVAPQNDLVGEARRLGVVSRDASRDLAKPEKKAKPAKPTELELAMAKPAVRKAIAGADTKLWTTEVLNLWTQPGDKADNVGDIDEVKKVLVTGRSLYGRDEVVLDGAARWVTAGYFSQEKPEAPDETVGIGGDCTNGSSVPSGVSPNIVKVHEAVCAAFPEITTYGTFRSDGEHAQGLAVDIMVSGSRGQEVADFVRENYAALGVNYLIYSQQIWSVDRASEGYRGMEDRGSTTANHYDHVHVTTY